MKQITAEEFKAAVEIDPAWASRLTEPVEITDFCNMKDSGITHLSPLLHFTSRGDTGNCANFINCSRLKVAEGTFEGWVGFTNSGIEKIGQLTITGTDNVGRAASFIGCKHLKVAEGTFPGYVSFADSGIRRIKNLHITNSDKNGDKANFTDCPHLRPPPEFLGREYLMSQPFRHQSQMGIAAEKAQHGMPDMEI